MSAKLFKFRADLAQSRPEQERAWKKQWMEQERIKRFSARRFVPKWQGIAVLAIMFLAVAVFVAMAIRRRSEPAAASVPWKDWNPE